MKSTEYFVSKIRRYSFLTLFAIFISCIWFVPVQAGSKKISDPYYTDNTNTKQHRFITIVGDDQWTKEYAISGQPEKGRYLKKKDALYYSENGGNSTTVSFSLGYGYASVGISIPFGKVSNASSGTILTNDGKAGYYKIYQKKEIRPTVKYIQYRTKVNGKWGAWTKEKIYSKSYKTIREKGRLKLMD